MKLIFNKCSFIFISSFLLLGCYSSDPYVERSRALPLCNKSLLENFLKVDNQQNILGLSDVKILDHSNLKENNNSSIKTKELISLTYKFNLEELDRNDRKEYFAVCKYESHDWMENPSNVISIDIYTKM